MKFPIFRFLSLAVALAAFGSRADAQLTLTIQATESFTTDYEPGMPELSLHPSLRTSTTSLPPASVDYNMLTNGTFTMRFIAPDDMKFVIDPQGKSLSLYFQVAYTTFSSGGASGGLSTWGEGSFSFVGLEGIAPADVVYSSTIADYPHAYLSASLSGTVTSAFSFTELVITRQFSGSGADLLVPYFEGGNLSIYDDSYSGAQPPDHPAYLSLAAIPEPSTYAAFAGLAGLTLAILRRRRG